MGWVGEVLLGRCVCKREKDVRVFVCLNSYIFNQCLN